MKKRFFIAVLVLLVAFGTAIGASAKSTVTLTTNGVCGLEMTLTDTTLKISADVENEDVYYIVVELKDKYLINVTPGTRFSTSLDLPDIASGQIDVGVYMGESLELPFTGVFFNNDIVLEKANGKWSFISNDTVYSNNDSWLTGWMDATEHLDRKQPEAVKMVATTVTQDISDNYEKAYAIHKWLADNIYYDKDYALNTKSSTALTPVEVLSSRVTVCEGYVNLAVSMLQAVGIPAVKVEGYSLVGSNGSWDSAALNGKANHAWVEAYVDGKWITMDPTWDCKNMSFNGKKEQNLPVVYRYFDISPMMLAAKHRITSRPNVFGKMGVSTWAFNEVLAARSNGLVTTELLTTMKNEITRAEFCRLVVNLVQIKLGKGIDLILEEKGLEINYDFFNDTSDYTILCANALGIVNGKENNMFDPDGFIRRQEAAVMLMRTAKVLGAEQPNDVKVKFSDAWSFPAWSKDAIDFISASVSSEGTRVMGGVENNRFDPSGHYTKEQSVLTIYRLFNTY